MQIILDKYHYDDNIRINKNIKQEGTKHGKN